MRILQRTLLSLLLVAVTCGARPALAQTAQARFEPSACPFPLGAGLVNGVDVRCGYLEVPADWHQTDSPVLRLAVADFKSGTTTPDPLVYLQGGPGGGIVDVLGPVITKKIVGQMAGGHDLILIDQRGTGLSEPSLSCPELVDAERTLLQRQLTSSQLTSRWDGAAEQCHDRLVRQGITLADYTTEADAADVAALGPALGYQQVDLYGVSYGTRVALTIMRLFPSGIRSVVLDAVLPPQTNLYTQYPLSATHAFSVLVAACATSPSCNRAHPHLNRMFVGLVHHLNARPVTIPINRGAGVGLLTGDRMALLTFTLLYSTRMIPEIPYLINAVAHDDDRLLATVVPPSTDHDFTLATYYSMLCSEDAPFVTRAQIITATQSLPTVLQPSILNDATGGLLGYGVCKLWRVPPVDQAQKNAVTSAIPTLVLTGEFDPVTPPTLGLLAAQTLRQSYVYTFPGVGHGSFLTVPCATSITLAFLANPAQRSDASCMATMKEPQFLTGAGLSPSG